MEINVRTATNADIEAMAELLAGLFSIEADFEPDTQRQAKGLAMMITCFPFMVTVLAILRQGLGLQQSPPNMLIVSLALFLVFYALLKVRIFLLFRVGAAGSKENKKNRN